MRIVKVPGLGLVSPEGWRLVSEGGWRGEGLRPRVGCGPEGRSGGEVIEFSFHEGTYTGVGRDGRRWRITRAVVGWRLEFRDPGDRASTYAGTHASVFAAQTEAGR